MMRENETNQAVKEKEANVKINHNYQKPSLNVVGKTTYIITMCKQSPCNGQSGGHVISE